MAANLHAQFDLQAKSLEPVHGAEMEPHCLGKRTNPGRGGGDEPFDLVAGHVVPQQLRLKSLTSAASCTT